MGSGSLQGTNTKKDANTYVSFSIVSIALDVKNISLSTGLQVLDGWKRCGKLVGFIFSTPVVVSLHSAEL